MIQLSKLKGQVIWVNPDLIETIEITPDTIIALTTGHRMYVRETPEIIRDKVIAYRRSINDRLPIGSTEGEISDGR